MKNALRIAVDSIRALLHQWTLLALVLVTLGMTSIASIALGVAQRNILARFDREPRERAAPELEGMSEADRKRMSEGMELAGSTFHALFHGAASFAGEVVSLFIFCTAVASEIRRGTIRVSLTKRVSRTEFLLGKYMGGVVVMLTYWVLMSAAIVFVAQTRQSQLSPAAPFAPFLMLCQHLMVGSVGLLLSLYVHPLVAGVVAFFASASFLSPPNPLYFILPSYDRFNLFWDLIMGSLFSPKDAVLLSLYALDFTVIMLLLAIWRFRNKELI